MTDKREAILVRLLAIAQSFITDGSIKNVYRNFDTLNEIERPAIILYDADQKALDAELPHSHLAAGIELVTMVPQMRVLIGDAPENIGTRLNAVGARLIYLVKVDTTLAELTKRPGRIRYQTTDTAFGWSRTQDGDMVVRFAFTYLLNPADLA